ncbi:hypothetical protein [Paenibacillus sp. ATY16]|uniref:hypothetical protein n=1 Tax=Paenibacillus sp. ATY16 TaxID=1759312 RepID=UPI002010A759|nr:hypothetical protein [Paenibacillus sp. ATY16]MCK9858193.1 hypothetical protein [Paenibacillus sp. ATY16]
MRRIGDNYHYLLVLRRGVVNMLYAREEIMKELSEKYFMFLKTLHFNDPLYMQAISEGKRKFLPALHMHLASRGLPNTHRIFTTDFITSKAFENIRKKSFKGLQYEHIVPKAEYIHDICEQAAKNNSLTVESIRELINRYLWTATVTKEEHHKLKKSMPRSWDGVNIMARYEAAGIQLLPHDKSYLYKS